MSGGDPFDMKNLRLTPEGAPLAKGLDEKVKSTRKAHEFVMVPKIWREELKKARHMAAALVAHELLRRAWREDSGVVTLPNGWGISRERKRRGLMELERLGLVAVEWRLRKSPLVTVRFRN
jgi:hypothetical protein